VYSADYNIGFLGLERLHPFDSGKWGKVFQYLKGTMYIQSVFQTSGIQYLPFLADIHLVDHHTIYSMICNL